MNMQLYGSNSYPYMPMQSYYGAGYGGNSGYAPSFAGYSGYNSGSYPVMGSSYSYGNSILPGGCIPPGTGSNPTPRSPGNCWPSGNQSGGYGNQNPMNLAVQTIHMMMTILSQLMGRNSGQPQYQWGGNGSYDRNSGGYDRGHGRMGGQRRSNHFGGNYADGQFSYDHGYNQGNGFGNQSVWSGSLSNGGYGSISFDGTNNGGVNIGVNFWGNTPWQQPGYDQAPQFPSQQCRPRPQPPVCRPQPQPCPPPPCPPEPPAYDGGMEGRYWGDPHLVGFDGEKYDVAGVSGRTYSMISDQNFQYNTKFESWGNNGATVVTQAGIMVGNSRVYYDRDITAPTVNSVAMVNGQLVALDLGGTALWDGTKLVVTTPEYTVDVHKVMNSNGNYLDSNITINEGGPFQDFVTPHGLLGQTADGIDGHKNSGVDQGNQGGTVISGTVADYEVSDIWATNDDYNRYDTQIDDIITDNQGNVIQVVDEEGNVVYLRPEEPVEGTASVA